MLSESTKQEVLSLCGPETLKVLELMEKEKLATFTQGTDLSADPIDPLQAAFIAFMQQLVPVLISKLASTLLNQQNLATIISRILALLNTPTKT